jgi:hypothetical protein
VFPKDVRDAKDGLVREALKVFGFFWWLVNYGLSRLTSSTLLSVKIYFLVQPNYMSHVFYTCAVPHHGNCEG